MRLNFPKKRLASPLQPSYQQDPSSLVPASKIVNKIVNKMVKQDDPGWQFIQNIPSSLLVFSKLVT